MADSKYQHIPADFATVVAQLTSERRYQSEGWSATEQQGMCADRCAAPSSTAERVCAGLVSSKTSHHEISFAPREQAKRRIKRLKRSVWSSGHLHGLANNGSRPPVAWFVTLTYVGVDDWKADHISKATHQFRQHCIKQGVPCRYLWVAELQKRGAVHYHLLAWLPKGVQMPKWDQSYTTPSGRTAGPFWGHGMTNTEVAKSGVGYLMKYLSKLGEFHQFPPHLRLYGVGGLNPDARQVRTWYNLPEWVKCNSGVGDVRRVESRLIIIETGEILEPLYTRHFYPGGVTITPVRPVPTRFHDGAYSTFPRATP